jgi:GDP-4-dehydro-6-deoxy-D-mannose reductase
MAVPSDAPVVVTGAEGFVGGWLVPELRRAGRGVVGTFRPGSTHPDLDARWVEVDLREASAVDALVADARPAAVIHLAAIAAPRQAAADPDEALRVNYGAVDHLARALVREAPDARLVYVSTGEVYGRRLASDPPAREDDPLAPPNPYAATKAAAEQRLALAFEREGLDVVRVRPFNHSGPGRPTEYGESNFARQVAELERSEAEPVVRVGNLEAMRDFSHVADVVAAYRLLLDEAEPGGVYNVCSGIPRSMRSVLEHLLSRARRELRAEVDEALFEPIPDDARQLVGDPARIRALGWRPAHSFESMLDELLEDWRARG